MPLNKTLLRMLMTCHLRFIPFALFEVHLTPSPYRLVGGGLRKQQKLPEQQLPQKLPPSHHTRYNLPVGRENSAVGAAHCPQSLSGTSLPLQQHQVLAWMRARLAEGSTARGGRGRGWEGRDHSQDPHLLLRPQHLGHPGSYFNRNVLCSRLSKNDRQPYNICFFFPSSFWRFCERFNQLDVFLINKSWGSYFFSFVPKVGMPSYRQLKTA